MAVALNTLHYTPVYGTRIKRPENGTISWFIHAGPHSEADDFYQAIHAHHLAQELPEAMKYLCLPEGAAFIFDKHGYKDVWVQ